MPGLADIWRCPTCEQAALRVSERVIVCSACAARYPVVGGRPVLLREDNALFPPSAYAEPGSGSRRQAALSRLVPSPSVNLSYERCLSMLAAELSARERKRVLIVGAGTERPRVARLLAACRPELVAVDVDTHADVDAWCDAHELPFVNQSFDAVIATAVLEHVLYPERAAAEIARVLGPAGLIYSEVPFMQQVHEGAYDFTRYTLSGHRRLLNQFDEISSGLVAGPFTALAWSIEHAAIALAPSDRLRAPFRLLGRLASFWLKYLDRLVARRPAALDAASCTYFLGRLRADRRDDASVVAAYSGAGKVIHV